MHEASFAGLGHLLLAEDKKNLARFRKAKKVVTAALQIMPWTVAGYITK